MNIKEAVKVVASKFEYRQDPDFLFDYWYVMKDRNGKYKGDCEDFSLTVFWELSGKKLGKFLWNLLVTHKYKMHFVKTKRTGEGHLVGEYDDLFFDNWTLEDLPKGEFYKKTEHIHHERRTVLSMWLFMTLGYIYRTFK
jgi:hypothetical protein